MGRKNQNLIHDVWRLSLSPQEYLVMNDILKTFKGNKSLCLRSIVNEYLLMKGYLLES